MEVRVSRVTLGSLLSLLIAAISIAFNPSQQAAYATPDSLAYIYLYETMDEYNSTFDVYSEKDAGGNHFVPSGVMGDSDDITIDAGCLRNPHSGLTCTKIHYSAAGTHGQNWAGIHWQSSESNWGEEQGYSLTGATSLVFWARGAQGGEDVEFRVGGINRAPDHDTSLPYEDSFGPLTTGVLTLSRAWRQYSIRLGQEDLSNLIGGFGCVTDIHQNPRGCLFFLDDIYFDTRRLDEPRFLTSYHALAEPFDKYIRNVAFTYDNALVTLAFMARGTDDDWRRARLLADAFLYAQEHDRFFQDGRLRNGYQSGDLANITTGSARLPGWWIEEDKMWYEDRYNAGTQAGNVAWVIIALCEFCKRNPAQIEFSRYVVAAERMGTWIVDSCYDSSGLGGYTGGYEGWEPDERNPHGQTKIVWKSTEHNIDVWVAFMRLSELSRGSSSFWRERAIHAKRFVEAMWNESGGNFWTGTKRCDDGTDVINRDVLPLDVNAWSLMALGGPDRYGKAMDWAERACYVGRGGGAGFEGFDFDGDRDGIWFEGTAQMCVAYQIMGQGDKAERFLEELGRAQASAGNNNGKGLVATPNDHISTGFEWSYYNRLHIAATAWFVFAGRRYNPYWGISSDEAVPYQAVR